MTDYVYNDQFTNIIGTIDGSDFDSHFSNIEIAIASKANSAGPVTHTGQHTFVDLVATTSVSIDGGVWT